MDTLSRRYAVCCGVISGVCVAAAVGCAGPMDQRPFEAWRETHRAVYADVVAMSESEFDHSASVAVDDDLPSPASLDDCIRYALKHHPGVQAAFLRWRAAVERIPQVRSLPDPQVTFSMVLDQVERRAEYMGERYALSQMFPWFGKLRLRGDAASEAAMAAAYRYEAERLALIERVVSQWVEWAYLNRAAQVAEESRTLMVHFEQTALARLRVGTTKQADVIRAQVEVGRLDDQVRSLTDMLGPTGAALNAAMGRAAGGRRPNIVDSPSAMPVSVLPAIDESAWFAAALRHNPELAALGHDAATRRREILLAKKEGRPDVMVGLEYARDGSARMGMMDGGGADMLMAMVSVNVPIWREKYEAGEREAVALFGASTREITDRRNTLDAEIRRALFDYRDAARKVELYSGNLVPKGRQAMTSIESAYRTSDATFTDVVDAQRVLLDFELASERAAADRLLAVARLHRLIGVPPDQLSKVMSQGTGDQETQP